MGGGELTLVTWNVMAPVPEPIRYTGQTERMHRIPGALVDQIDPLQFVDVCVVQESIDQDLHAILRQGMQRAGFVYETSPLVGSLLKFQIVEGGLVLFSRHPILQQGSVVFQGLCDREDCLAAKGVVYAEISKGGQRYHVFALHLNSWETSRSRTARSGQMKQVAEFVERQRIPSDEAVVLAGDFNVDLYSQQMQIRQLCDVVQFSPLRRHPETAPYSSDPMTNQLMGMDDPSAYASEAYPDSCLEEYSKTLHCVCCPQEWLDYGMYSRLHAPVDTRQSWMRVVPAKVAPFHTTLTMTVRREIVDLSDHYPLLVHYVFPELAPPEGAGSGLTSYLEPHQYEDMVADRRPGRAGLRVARVVGFLVTGVALVCALLLTSWLLLRSMRAQKL